MPQPKHTRKTTWRSLPLSRAISAESQASTGSRARSCKVFRDTEGHNSTRTTSLSTTRWTCSQESRRRSQATQRGKTCSFLETRRSRRRTLRGPQRTSMCGRDLKIYGSCSLKKTCKKRSRTSSRTGSSKIRRSPRSGSDSSPQRICRPRRIRKLPAILSCLRIWIYPFTICGGT